ncbi:MAG: recombination protein NinG [Candidatus Thorarchaeota archaeon]
MKRKIKTIKDYKKEAWKWFSVYIRLKYSQEDGWVQCVTCKKWFHWRRIQAGHFVGGRKNNVLLNEKVVRPQCFHCNVGLKGNYLEFRKHYVAQGLTDDEIDLLQNLKNCILKRTENDWIFLTAHFHKLARKEAEKRGIKL